MPAVAISHPLTSSRLKYYFIAVGVWQTLLGSIVLLTLPEESAKPPQLIITFSFTMVSGAGFLLSPCHKVFKTDYQLAQMTLKMWKDLLWLLFVLSTYPIINMMTAVMTIKNAVKVMDEEPDVPISAIGGNFSLGCLSLFSSVSVFCFIFFVYKQCKWAPETPVPAIEVTATDIPPPRYSRGSMFHVETVCKDPDTVTLLNGCAPSVFPPSYSKVTEMRQVTVVTRDPPGYSHQPILEE